VPFQEGYTLRAFYNYSNVTDAYLRLTNTLLILSPFLILIISLGGYFIVKKALSPLQTIIDSSARIKRQNDYSIRIETLKQQDELSNVILVLNDLLDKFEQTIKREQQFSANVSHELRTPVAVLKAQIEYIQSLKDPNDINQELAELNGEISQLERLVNQLLELSRSKHIRTLTYAELDIRLALNTLIKSYDKEINALNLRLNLDLNVDNTPFITEPTLFNRIMSNLLSNAIKYNKVNGFVEIIVTEHEAMYQIDVKDSGVGIDHLDLDNIFNPFYQTDPSRSSQHLSLGIGLTLTKELIEVLKGTITVKSTLNKGSTFTVTLPKIQSI
jgi:signal transduction histidine kinase